MADLVQEHEQSGTADAEDACAALSDDESAREQRMSVSINQPLSAD